MFVYFTTCQVSTPQKAVLQMYRFTSFFRKYKSNLLVKRVLLNIAFATAILGFISRTISILHDLFSSGYPDI
jgi:hypothetical protein